MTKREEIENQKNICMNALLNSHKYNKQMYLSLEDFAILIKINRNITKEENRLRSVIQLARDGLKELGFVVSNKRNVGYRIAIGVDSLDEKEKQCQRAYKMICGAGSKIFNNTFIEDDLQQVDIKRVNQYYALEEFRSVLFTCIDELRASLVKSPYRGKNLSEIKNSIDVQIGKDEI